MRCDDGQRQAAAGWLLGRVLPLALCLAGVLTASAERLSVRAFTIADGLAGDWVTALYRDSRGYLWVGTPRAVTFDTALPSYPGAITQRDTLARVRTTRRHVVLHDGGLVRAGDPATGPGACSAVGPRFQIRPRGPGARRGQRRATAVSARPRLKWALEASKRRFAGTARQSTASTRWPRELMGACGSGPRPSC
jgi:hypothetical protein